MAADTKRGADRIICLIDEGDEFHVSLSSLRDELALHGLHVVTAADKAVLDAVRECYEAAPGALPESVWRAQANLVITRREAAK